MKPNFKITAFVHLTVLIAIIILPSILPKQYKHRLPTVHNVNLVNLPKQKVITKPSPPKKKSVPKQKKKKKTKPKKKKSKPKPKKKSIVPKKKTPTLKERLAKRLEDTPKFKEPETVKRKFTEPTTQPQLRATVSSSPDFPFQWYLDFIQSKISSCWNQPQMTIAKDYTTMISFTILKDGSVASLRTRRSSGIPIFDQSTLQAVKTAQPLPPIPAGYSHNQLVVNVEFRLE